MRLKRHLHLARVHLHAAGDDHLLRPSIDDEVPGILVEPADVAGAEPAVAIEECRRDLWAAEKDLAVVAESQLDARQRDANRVRRRVGDHLRRVEPAFGRAVAHQRRPAQNLFGVRGHSATERRRPADAQPEPVALSRALEPLVHRRHREQHSRLFRRAQQLLGVEPRQQVQRRTRDQSGVKPAQPVLVEQRQRVHQDVVALPPPRRHRCADRGQQVAVGERDALRLARGA